MHLSSYISHWNTIHTYHILQHVLSWFSCKTTMHCTRYMICISLLTSHIGIPYIHTIYYNTYSVDSVARLRCIVLDTWYASLFLHLTLEYHTYIPYITTCTQLIQLQDYDALYSIHDMHLSSYISHWNTIHTYHILQHVLSWFSCKTTMHCTRYMICISLLTSHIGIPYIHTIYYNMYSVDSVARLRCIVLDTWYASLFLHLTLEYHTYIPYITTCTQLIQLQDYDALYSIHDMHLSSYISHWNTIHTYHILQHVLSWFSCKTTMHCTRYMICISLLTSHIGIPYIHTIYYNMYSVDSVARLRCIVLDTWYASLFLHLTLEYHTYIPYITTCTQLIQLQDYDALYSIHDLHLSSYISHWNTIHTYHILQHVLSWFSCKTTIHCTQCMICISLLTPHIGIPYIVYIPYITTHTQLIQLPDYDCIVLDTWYASLFLHLTLEYHTYIPYITTHTQLIQLPDYDALYSIYDMHLSSYISHWNTIHTYHILQHILSWFSCQTTMHCTRYMICISLLTSHIGIPYIHTLYYNMYSVDSVARLQYIVLNVWYASLFLHLTLEYHTYIPYITTHTQLIQLPDYDCIVLISYMEYNAVVVWQLNQLSMCCNIWYVCMVFQCEM